MHLVRVLNPRMLATDELRWRLLGGHTRIRFTRSPGDDHY